MEQVSLLDCYRWGMSFSLILNKLVKKKGF
jgi:hypothetical protein